MILIFCANNSMSLLNFVSITFAYICVVRISVCPSILETLSMGTPLAKVMVVANVWRARWKERSNMSNGDEKQA